MSKLSALIIFLFWVSLLSAQDLLDCRKSVEAKIQNLEQGTFRSLLIVSSDLRSWVKAGKSFAESFQSAETYQGVRQDSAESFLYANALQSCLDFRDSFTQEVFKYQLIFGAGFLLISSVLGLVIYWRFR